MEIRRLKIGEEKEAVQLSDQIFRDNEQKSMGDAFPFIFLPNMIDGSYGCFIDGKLVSFMGLVPSTVRIGESRLPIYSLGSVCTHPDYRGKGYAGKILEVIMADLKDTEASLLLVSGDRSLYTRVGCCFFGKAHIFNIKKENHIVSNDDVVLREMVNTDLHRMHVLASNREVAYEQTASELSLLINSEAYASCVKRNHKVIGAEKDGCLETFVVVAVPYIEALPKKGIAIEWAGNPNLIPLILKEAIERYGLDQLEIRVPWQERELKDLLNEEDTRDDYNRGTLYVVDPERLLTQLKPYLVGNRNRDELWKAEKDGNYIHLISSKEKIVHLTDEEFVSFIFNPNSNLENTLDGLSIPMPYTAGLNYI